MMWALFYFVSMEKIIVYPASRVFHNDVMPAVHSAIANSGADTIWIMTDTEDFPNQLPDNVHTIDVSKQEWFKPGSPNYRNEYSFICLVRVALAKLFPDADRILSLDADTIIEQDVSELWNLDMQDYYLAGVPEALLSNRLRRPYINMGMAFFNLEKIREDHLDDKMIEDLNHKWYQWVEQDCINENTVGKVLVLGPEYNASQFSDPCDYPKIWHFAYTFGWQNKEVVQKYK